MRQSETINKMKMIPEGQKYVLEGFSLQVSLQKPKLKIRFAKKNCFSDAIKSFLLCKIYLQKIVVNNTFLILIFCLSIF